MKIKQVKTGYLEENCYILIKGSNCLIIDPGDDYNLIKQNLEKYNPIGILITHNHFDHVGAIDDILNDYKIKIYNKYNLKEEINNIENFSFEVIYTPGHSEDSISFYFDKENSIFVGDFIFKGSIGRCDLPTGDFKEMEKSLIEFKNHFKNNPDLEIYPGHGEKTTLEKELKYNIYFL